jgi:membrane associated rhomboid family serine protease
MFSQLTLVVRTILIANAVVFGLQNYAPYYLTEHFALFPWGEQYPDGSPLFHVWQLLSYAFLHGSVGHIFFNMFAVWMFGPELERILGPKRFAIYYVVCAIGAALTQQVVQSFSSAGFVPTVGASGAVFGLLLLFGMAFPNRRLVLLFPPIPMPAWVFVTLYALAELAMGVFNLMPGVAHYAHLGGMAAGFLLIRYWRAIALARGANGDA